ncbi:MAG: hypothetical protein JWR69_92 [Pedosphaera sp.]|nr:hypothetical protein [Pedosphaera sp.]
MILADLPAPNANAFWQGFLIIVALLGVLVNAVTIWVLLSNRKEHREVSFAFEPASKVEFKEHVKHNTDRHAQLFRSVETVERKAATELREAVRVMEVRIEKNQDEVKETIRNLPMEIVAMLKNTKGLLE